jgi:phage tail sheath protein FI
MVNIDTTAGVWVAPAGLQTVLTNVVQAERPLAPSDMASLNLGNVNALRTRANGQVVIWGTRTMQAGYATLYVPIRRTLNYIESSLVHLLEFAVFQPNDQLLWTQISAICNNFLSGLYAQNAFPGQNASTSYYVTCDATNNTPQTISQGIVNTTIGVALLYPAEFISLLIAQFQSTGQTTVTQTTI